MQKVVLSLVLSLFAVSVNAAEIKLNDITEQDLKNIVREMSGNFNYTSVSGAASLGENYGYEIGLLLGVGATPKLSSLVHTADPSSELPYLPNAALLGALSIAYGLTFEAAFMPKVGTSEFKFSNLALAAKWTVTNVYPEKLPVELAFKLHTQTTTIQGNTTIDGVPSVLDFKDKLMGLDVLVSKNFGVYEPYASIGLVQADGELSASGSGTLFNTSFTAGNSAKEKSSSIQFTAGSEFKFGLFKMGLEYSRLFDMNRLNTKMAFYF